MPLALCSRRLAGCTLLAAGLMAASPCSRAVPPPVNLPPGDEGATAQPGSSVLDGITRSSALLGDLGGLRTAMSRRGLSLAIEESSEVLGNPVGGNGHAFEYDGLTQMVLQWDTRRGLGHPGGLLNLSVLDSHGRNLSGDHLGSLQTASGIEADPALRLWEFWYQQKFLEEDRLDLRVGQLALDQEFMVSGNALAFVNTMFGWPMLPSADLPAGGPAYPLSALGARLAARPVDGITLLGAVVNASPVRHPDSADPQQDNRHGTSFPWGAGALAVFEVQYAYPSVGAMVEPDSPAPLGWTWRIGAWYDSRSFADLAQDTQGRPLADDGGSGVPLPHGGDHAFYSVLDRLLWRDAVDANRTLAAFLRVMGTPLNDRNLVDASANLGITMRSPFRYRAGDVFGLGAGYAHTSATAARAQREAMLQGTLAPGPVRGSECFVELTYLYQWHPWIQLQPDLQYVFRPGAGIPRPGDPGQRIPDALVLGLRVNVAL